MSRTCSIGLQLAALAGLGLQLACADDFAATTEPVGRTVNGLQTPVNQLVTPAGTQVELPGVRPNALALSPDGKLLVTAGLTNTFKLIVVDPATGKISQRVPLPADQVSEQAPVSADILGASKKSQLSFTGLAFSPDGSRIYMANVNGDIKVFGVATDETVSPLLSLALPLANAPQRTNEIPAGLAVSRDGRKLYVAGNLSNRLLELDAANGTVLRTWDVGVAPFAVVLCKHKLYVSNWGGRRPAADSVTGPAGRGMLVRVDDRSIANEGSVSVIDLNSEPGTQNAELLTGLHACALALAPNQKFLAVANAGSDTVSVIDTRTDKIAETICVRQNPGDPFGAQPDALAFDRSGKTLFVGNGTQNAVAVVQFQPGQSKLLGLIPVGWFPSALAFDAGRNQLCVANLKNIGDQKENPRKGFGHAPGFNSKQYTGSLSLVRVPTPTELAAFTQTALADLRYPLLVQAQLPPRAQRPPQPVPERAGEPGVFHHVIYIIRENRSYDQVLGDVTAGNGDPDLCVFGEHVTPNAHRLVRDFALLDNTYCCGALSADGHNWTDSGIATDYVERSFAGWPRSYPAGGGGDSRDALAYSPAGFIWNNALAHGCTVRDFGEFTGATNRWRDPARTNKLTFTDCYRDFITGADQIVYACEPDIEAMRPFVKKDWPSWDLNVPDVVRAKKFIAELKQFETNGNFPNLTLLWLGNDHTSATKTSCPTPAAMLADNDLAFGQVVAAVSHSKFWADTCIFTIEDDPQNGWDHVSGYRTTAYVISPFTRRGAVVRTQYNTTSVLRTMELMLGLPPMNQMDATATPMFDCFTNVPDFSAYDAVTNNVPLDELNPPPKHITDAQRRKDALVSGRLPLDLPDQCNEDVLNRILWRATMGAKPYPEWAVKKTDED